MNPILKLQLLTPLLVLFVVIGLYLSWRSSAHARKGTRMGLLAIRTLALSAIAYLFINPGKWVSPESLTPKQWPILIDNSSSMAVEHDAVSRLDSARTLHTKIVEKAKAAGVEVQTFSYSDSINAVDELDSIEANAAQSDLLKAGGELFSQLQAKAVSPQGLIVLTDGRQTSQSAHSNFILHSRAHNAPIYTVPLGQKVEPRDLSLHTPKPTITAFANQEIQLTAHIKNQKVKGQTVLLELIDGNNEVIAKEKVTLKEDETSTHTFSLKSPQKSTSWKLRIPTLEGEQRNNNNSRSVYLRILKTKTRIFIAEGAPYWDSKFLAQHLRGQSHMTIHSVHRLNDQRFFKISSDKANASESNEDIFPNTPEEFAQYDLIILGKNAEHFLTPQRCELLRNFVRDQGGAVLFARGKAYSGKLPELEPLEPVSWATGNTSNFSLHPTPDGATSGLFGQALPGMDNPVWESLPPLKDAHQIDSVKPFTRVLATGALENNRSTFPLLVIRRYGQGVTGLVNADGLWKWDFYPEAKELGNMYSEFWTQLLQWMVAYSDFLPGYNYALRSSSTSSPVNESLTLTLQYRGEKKSPQPRLQIRHSNGETHKIAPATSAISNGTHTWKTSYTPKLPGRYEVSLLTDDKSPSPSVQLDILAPPQETDNLAPDPEFLAKITKETGGKVVLPAELDGFLDTLFSQKSSATQKAELVWMPAWANWLCPLILLGLLGTEWFIRRRSGLS